MDKGIADDAILDDEYAWHLKTITDGGSDTVTGNDARLKASNPGVQAKKLGHIAFDEAKSSVIFTLGIADVNRIRQLKAGKEALGGL